MNSEKNSVELKFRSYTEDRDLDLTIAITYRHVDNDS